MNDQLITAVLHAQHNELFHIVYIKTSSATVALIRLQLGQCVTCKWVVIISYRTLKMQNCYIFILVTAICGKAVKVLLYGIWQSADTGHVGALVINPAVSCLPLLTITARPVLGSDALQKLKYFAIRLSTFDVLK